VVFLTPVKGRAAQEAARDAGLKPATQIATLRVEGPDRPGLGSRLSRAIADAGVNVRGVSAMVIGNRFVAYVGLDSPDDLARATRALKSVDAARPARRTGATKASRPARRPRASRAMRATR
jgi:predicted amino acid-binding ACT domain protein